MNKKAEQFLLSLVEENYQSIADNFALSRKKPMKKMVYNIVEDLDFRQDFRILDLASGNGCFFEVLDPLKKGLFYLGLDNSEKLVKIAQKNYGNYFKRFNLLNLEKLIESNFKYIFSWAFFHHLPGKKTRKKFLKDVYNKLEEGGLFVFSVWRLRKRKNFFNLALSSYWRQMIEGRIIDWGDLIFPWKGFEQNNKKQGTKSRKNLSNRYYHAFSLREIKRLLKKTSFQLEKILEDDFNYYFILKK